MDESDGLIDFVIALSGNAQPDVAPIEKVSDGGASIVTARAVQDHGAVFVYGSVRKVVDRMTTAYSHIEVSVLNMNGQVLEDAVTDYFPSEIPNSRRGIEGRSHFSVRLSHQIPTGAMIRVAFRSGPLSKAKLADTCDHEPSSK